MPLLTREQILAAKDVATERVNVPEWGGEVIVRGLTGRNRDRFEALMTANKGNAMLDNACALMAAWCVVDENGQRLFTDEDVEQLGEKNARILVQLFQVAGRLSGTNQDDIKEMIKNSEAAPSG